MRGAEFDCVLDARATVGEGAIWSVAMGRLLWVDIPAGRLNRFDPESGRNESWDLGRPVGCVAETADGGVVAALTDGFFAIDLPSGGETHIAGPRPIERNHRFNDGSVDPAGRFYAGTMPLGGASADDASGTLYVLDGGTTKEVMTGFHVINGLAFSPDGRTAYVSDSFPTIRTILAYDYDVATAVWSNKRVFFDTSGVAGRPDGGAVDADGCYWMAGVGGWQVYRITPSGMVDRVIDVPVEKPTRIAFGGADLGTLFVTSIRVADDSAQPLSGGVFATHVPGVRGVAMPVMPAAK